MTWHSLKTSGFVSLLSMLGASVALNGQTTGPARSATEAGIPVTDPLVIAKCGSCHKSDERQNMERVSWRRGTPEGWQDVLRSMALQHGLAVTPEEARTIVKYLSDTHGLAPAEAKPVMYFAERRVHDEADLANATLRDACAKCHPMAKTLGWRRSAGEWRQLARTHAAKYNAPVTEPVLALLSKMAPLHTPEWDSWSKREMASLTGRWLVTAHLPGRGNYYGQLEVNAAATGGELSTRMKIQSIADGAAVMRTGRIVVYGGYAWRGRSRGTDPSTTPGADPVDPGSDAREVMWFSPDQSKGEGRWFWGQYQEFGFDVKLQRVTSDVALMGIEGASLKIGSQGSAIRLIGANFPTDLTTDDLDLGPGITVKRIGSRGIEVLAFVDVAAGAAPGRRDVVLRKSGTVVLKASAGAVVYDRVDYLKVIPDTSLAAFSDITKPRGLQQFEAIGYQRGADGKLHTADDLALGPIESTWSTKVFYATDDATAGKVGSVDATGLYTPAVENPNTNFDVWVVATATEEKDKAGEPLVGKGYLVVTIPSYTMRGRRYVRDLDRWVDDGPATAEAPTRQ